MNNWDKSVAPEICACTFSPGEYLPSGGAAGAPVPCRSVNSGFGRSGFTASGELNMKGGKAYVPPAYLQYSIDTLISGWKKVLVFFFWLN